MTPRRTGAGLRPPGASHGDHGPVERVLSVTSPWYAEHTSRYRLAAEDVEGATVLDIACGSGLGAAFLRRGRARTLVGVDQSQDAVVSAARSTIYDVVCRGDALSLPFPDQVFDVIISFETLEHLAKPDVFVGELRRVLRTNGKLLLSTPNALVSLPKAGVPQNPFHVHEFEPEELRQLLSVSFARVSLMGQHVDERYPSCPYWDFPGQREPSLSGWIHGLWWKALNILPTRWGSVLYERVHGRSLYPKEEDFCFSEEAVERAHVLVATCG